MSIKNNSFAFPSGFFIANLGDASNEQLHIANDFIRTLTRWRNDTVMFRAVVGPSLHRLIMIRQGPSIHCCVGSTPSSPPFSVFRDPLCLPDECVDFFSAPFLDVVQPFSAWSSSPRLLLHHSKHHLLYQRIVLHPAYVSKQV